MVTGSRSEVHFPYTRPVQRLVIELTHTRGGNLVAHVVYDAEFGVYADLLEAVVGEAATR